MLTIDDFKALHPRHWPDGHPAPIPHFSPRLSGKARQAPIHSAVHNGFIGYDTNDPDAPHKHHQIPHRKPLRLRRHRLLQCPAGRGKHVLNSHTVGVREFERHKHPQDHRHIEHDHASGTNAVHHRIPPKDDAQHEDQQGVEYAGRQYGSYRDSHVSHPHLTVVFSCFE